MGVTNLHEKRNGDLRENTKHPPYFKHGSEKGSGGLWNNAGDSPAKNPLVHADNPIGQWNTFRIIQIGARTSI
ncbi:MAG: hypothetical protein AAGC97_15520, partial [Planctomycetota bacterium]